MWLWQFLSRQMGHVAMKLTAVLICTVTNCGSVQCRVNDPGESRSDGHYPPQLSHANQGGLNETSVEGRLGSRG